MVDRVPLYPGRVKMTPVSGQANIYDMERADQPTQVGTPLNKTTLLKDSTAALYGLTDATPDDVFQKLGDSAFSVGDIRLTNRQSIGANWALCNGDAYDAEEYPAYQTFQESTYNLEKGFIKVNANMPYVYGMFEDGVVIYKESSTSYTIYFMRKPYHEPAASFLLTGTYDVYSTARAKVNGTLYYFVLGMGDYLSRYQYKLYIFEADFALKGSTYLLAGTGYLRDGGLPIMAVTTDGRVVINGRNCQVNSMGSEGNRIFYMQSETLNPESLQSAYTLTIDANWDNSSVDGPFVISASSAGDTRVVIGAWRSGYASQYHVLSYTLRTGGQNELIVEKNGYYKFSHLVVVDADHCAICENGLTVIFDMSGATPVETARTTNPSIADALRSVQGTKTYLASPTNGIYTLAVSGTAEKLASNSYGWTASEFAIVDDSYALILQSDNSLIYSGPGRLPIVSIDGANAFVKVK